jgi:hypothetical protein
MASTDAMMNLMNLAFVIVGPNVEIMDGHGNKKLPILPGA